ncbi:winged helix-turn-helix domain-containing protein [Propionibacterium cyclohexanicum]|uniref:winged helix-turn-helix domain-containing protein n=1 Tax=Propionibacterium cyclohexanicum TaxID=64702 RepID=UPI0015A5FDCC|nr:winged helix-turn-helix domain-containing protein [Propionibacterium cyclohexanicum]
MVRLVLHDPDLLEARAPSKELAKVVVDLGRHQVSIGARPINLTNKEFRLLTHLIENEGETVPRAELLDTLWAGEPEPRPNPRTIDVHIRRLRVKLGEFEDIVHTVRGIGYRFDRHADVQVRAA